MGRRRTVKTSSGSEDGFTLFELIVALLALAVISALVFQRTSNEPLLLASQAERLASDIRYVQSISMSQGQRYLFRALSSTTYELEQKGGAQIPHPSGTASPITLSAGITMSPTTFIIGFDGQGAPYTDVNVSTALASNTTSAITLTLNSSTRQVVVYSETGRVLVQ